MQIFKGQALFAPKHERHENKFDTQVKFLQQGTLAFRNLIKVITFPNNVTCDVMGLSRLAINKRILPSDLWGCFELVLQINLTMDF